MRVAVVHAEVLPIPPVLGGAIGQIVYETVAAMPDIEWQVISRWDKALDSLKVDGRFFYVNIDSRLAAVRRVLHRLSERPLSADETRKFCYVDGAAEILCTSDPDVVQVENRPTFVPYLRKRLPNASFVLFMHNEPDFQDPRVLQAIEASDRIAFVSQYLADSVCYRYPNCERKSEVVYNAVDPALWQSGLAQHKKAKEIRREYNLVPERTVLRLDSLSFLVT
jgi:spore coat protein SA